MIPRTLMALAASILCLGLAFDSAQAQCNSTATTNANLILVCPAGDGGFFESNQVPTSITVQVIDNGGVPVPNVPRCDFWLIDCDPVNDMVLCGGSQSSNADTDTDPAGFTRISGPISGGGCATGIAVVVQGVILNDPLTACTSPICLAVEIRSPDLNGDLTVSLVDLAAFASSWPPGPYGACADFNIDGVVALQDLVKFAAHFLHSCAVPPCP